MPSTHGTTPEPRRNLTDYDYDVHGHLMQKVEGKNTPDARTSRYLWDESTNHLMRVTVDGDHESTFSYNGDNRLSGVSERNLKSIGLAMQVRTTTYTYTKHPNGMLATVTKDGPLLGTGDAIVTSYNALGDLTSVRNSLGHETVYSQYMGLGLPHHIVDENGAVTDLTYDERGRTTNVRTYPNGQAGR